MKRDFHWLAGLLGFGLDLRRPLNVICLLAALAVVPRLWMDLRADSLSSEPRIWAMHRMELGYLVATAQTAQSLPPSASTPEASAPHGGAFPRGPLLLHAMLLRGFGAPGLTAADAVTVLLGYVIWSGIFRLLTGHQECAVVFAAAVVNGSAAHVLEFVRLGCQWLYLSAPPFSKGLMLAAVLAAIGLAVLQVQPGGRWAARGRRFVVPAFLLLVCWVVYLRFDGAFWSLRFPRPLVTSIASNLWLLSLLMLWLRPARQLPYLLAGGLAGVVLQSDIFSFGSLALVTVAVVVLRGKWGARTVGFAALCFAVVALPFAVKQIRLSPEMLDRLGMIPLRRAEFFTVADGIIGPWPVTGFALLAALAACLLLLHRAPRRPLWVFALLAVAMVSSLPLLSLVAGRAVQPWHYFYLVPAQLTLLAIAGLARVAGSSFGQLPASPRRGAALAGGVLCLAGGVAGELRGWDAPVIAGTVERRADFAELVRELQQPAYDARLVLGSFLPEARAEWALSYRPVLNPDPFATRLTDHQLEQRVLHLARLQNLSTSAFARLLQNNDPARHTAFWHLGHYKYQVSRWHALADRREYGAFEENDFVLPPSTLQRLIAEYADADDAPAFRCDLMVVENPGLDPPAVPPGFALAFSNRSYQLLRREPPASPSPPRPRDQP